MIDLDSLTARLSAIDWTKYRGGPLRASIPQAVMTLASGREEARREAEQYLEQALLPRSHLAEITCYALPFLVELAQEFRHATELYALLGVIAICARSREPDDYDEEIEIDGRRGSLAGKCRETLATGLPSFVAVVQDPECPLSCRSDSIWVVDALSEWRAAWLPQLARAHERERDPQIREELAEVLAGRA
jgi:hypothetical protein